MTPDTTSLTLTAKDLYHLGRVAGLAFDESRQAVILEDEALIETDADGAGHPSDQDKLSTGVCIRKEFQLDSATASEATLLVLHTVEELWKTKAYDAPVEIRVNGHAYKAVLKTEWNDLAIDPTHLRAGRNEIVLSAADAAAPPIIPFAGRTAILDNAPWRAASPTGSFRSADGGKTWSRELGGSGEQGEYNIRLRLRQFAPTGECESQTIDLADPQERHIVKPLATVRAVRVAARSECPPGTAVVTFLRTGQTPLFDQTAWEEWRLLCVDRPYAARGCYAQVKAVLTTLDGKTTPALSSIEVRAEVESAQTERGRREDASDHGTRPGHFSDPGRVDESKVDAIEMKEFVSHPVVHGGMAFEYEPLAHPRLAELRAQYRLDDVVAGAKSQFEMICRLNHWVCRQWDWHPPDPVYPEWSALDILRRKAGGKALGGFCGHYAIVMVQCCLSMGLQARYVFGCTPGVILGHEVAEVWSDEHGKWVLMDPNLDRHYLDRATSVPMNMLDLHRALLAHFFPRGLGTAEENKSAVTDEAFAEYLRSGPAVVYGGHDAAIPKWFDPRRAHLMWGHPMMMPRSSFFSRPRPMPRQHGFGMIWSWSGYRHWRDAATPPQARFGGHTDREADFYWNLNQVELRLEATAEEGVLRVTAGANAPDLETLLASIDGGPWQPTAPAFFWKLHKGANSLQMRTRNTRGVEGAVSKVVVTHS